ncbi:hypothetical protein [Archangium lipolyticum]|uniref:hypothetical protein n=1 Tax=Archangium lipolyticum TaxID=2970465 RepID=UPI002149A215|nr:hypothetical protein [Archangium lipolyticum]
MPIIMDERLGERGPTRLEEGPVVGYVDMPYKQLPERTRLFGQVWTAGENVIVRYDAAQVPGGRRVPFCAEVDDSGGQVKDPVSPPSVAIIQDNVAMVRVVARYGELDSVDRPKAYISREVYKPPPAPRSPPEK